MSDSGLDNGSIFLDVREQSEWDIEHIPGAVHIPQDRVAAEVEQALPDKSAPIVVYCRTGRRSANAAIVLEGLGYRNVRNLEGGIVQWLEEGLPVVSESSLAPDQLHRYSRHLLIP